MHGPGPHSQRRRFLPLPITPEPKADPRTGRKITGRVSDGRISLAPVSFTDNAQLFNTIQGLVEGWCDRRCLKALRAVLRGYPLSSPFTDGWGDLLIALQDVYAIARSELTDRECSEVEECIRAVTYAVHRREL